MVLAMWGREKASMLHSIVSTENILIGAAGELAHLLFVNRRELLQSAIVLGVSLLLWLLLWLCLETLRRYAERRELEHFNHVNAGLEVELKDSGGVRHNEATARIMQQVAAASASAAVAAAGVGAGTGA